MSPYLLYVYKCVVWDEMFVLCCRHRVEREEKAKLRSAGQSWKDKSFQPHELAQQLEDDRRRFQLRVVEVSTNINGLIVKGKELLKTNAVMNIQQKVAEHPICLKGSNLFWFLKHPQNLILKNDLTRLHIYVHINLHITLHVIYGKCMKQVW